MLDAPLLRVESGHHRCMLSLRDFVAGQWCELRVEYAAPEDFYILILRFEAKSSAPDPLAGAIVTYAEDAVFGVPAGATSLYVDVFGLQASENLRAVLKGVSRAAASWKLLSLSPGRAIGLLRRGTGAPLQRLRALLVALAAGRPRWLDYATWHRAFDGWHDEDRSTLFGSPEHAAWPSIHVLVDQMGATAAAIDATKLSLQQQWLNCPSSPLAPGRLVMPDQDYVAILQAGEIPPPHALSVLADQAAKAGLPAALYADEDELGPDGERRAPHFKPQAGPLFLCSGLLTRGIWMVRRDILAGPRDMDVRSADQLRLALGLRVAGLGEAAGCVHIPFVLTHRRFDTVPASPRALLTEASGFLDSRHYRAAIEAVSIPLRITPDIAALQAHGQPAKISIVIPTTAREPHVASCLDSILRHTLYPDFDIVLVVSQVAPLDADQETLLAPLRNRGNVQVLWLEAKSFNFSRAINAGVAASDGASICLLNDDIVPLHDSWLWTLAGHLQDHEVGIVGPKLLYPDGTVQHGGVIMGLGGGCAHAHRLLPDDSPGYAFRACLDQDLSSVTGACLLVRRDLFESLGGLDETYPIAFNDIDFCLRAREAGWRVIYAASTTLLHYETISLGGHYEGERDGLGAQELGRLRARWSAVIAADPFHNPNLSLLMGHEWDAELPPRVTKPFGFPRQDWP